MTRGPGSGSKVHSVVGSGVLGLARLWTRLLVLGFTRLWDLKLAQVFSEDFLWCQRGPDYGVCFATLILELIQLLVQGFASSLDLRLAFFIVQN